MNRYSVVAAPPEHFWWVRERTGCALTPEARAIEALDGSGRIRGMVAYDSWTENCVQLHIAVDAPIVWRHLLRPGLQYPFLQANRGMCLGLISERNRRSCAFAEAVGFREIARIPDGLKVGEDLVLFQLRREDCRYLGQEKERRAA